MVNVITSQDLATAFLLVLGNEKASKQVFNISGEKYVTFDGLAKACAKVTLEISLQSRREMKTKTKELPELMVGVQLLSFLVFVLCLCFF